MGKIYAAKIGVAKTIQSSSVVERSAVNRLVVGSNPTSGAKFSIVNFSVYVLQNPSGQFYVGQRENLEKRLTSHNRKDKFAGKFTRKNAPWSLLWSEPHPTGAAAMAREREIKKWKSAKLIQDRLLKFKE
jgi:putative endonuclease